MYPVFIYSYLFICLFILVTCRVLDIISMVIVESQSSFMTNENCFSLINALYKRKLSAFAGCLKFDIKTDL